MLLKTSQIVRQFKRTTANGEYVVRKKTTQYKFQCDGCGVIFYRTSKETRRTQLRDGAHHACSECQGPKFASKASATRRKTLKLDASSTVPIDKLR